MKVEKKVVPSPPVPPPTVEYVITLTDQQATDLYNLLGCISGGVSERDATFTPLWRLLQEKMTALAYSPFSAMHLKYKPDYKPDDKKCRNG